MLAREKNISIQEFDATLHPPLWWQNWIRRSHLTKPGAISLINCRSTRGLINQLTWWMIWGPNKSYMIESMCNIICGEEDLRHLEPQIIPGGDHWLVFPPPHHQLDFVPATTTNTWGYWSTERHVLMKYKNLVIMNSKEWNISPYLVMWEGHSEGPPKFEGQEHDGRSIECTKVWENYPPHYKHTSPK